MNTNYKKMLKDLGIEKPKDEPLTDLELRQTFVGIGEGLLTD